MGRDLVFTAAEAKEMSEDPSITLSRIYKYIKDDARSGLVETHYDIYKMSSVTVDKVCQALTDAGYTVTIEDEGHDLVITW